MKKLALIALCTILTAFVSKHQDEKGLARVQVVLGKEVYVMCQPVREYEVVDKMSTALGTMVVGRSTIQKQMQEVVNRGLKQEQKGKISFDAVMTDDGDQAVLIKFKD